MSVFLVGKSSRYECLKGATVGISGTDPSICELFLSLLHTGDLAARGEADFLARYGLNQARLIVLALLDQTEKGSMRSSELADQANVSRASMTGLLDTLEKAELATRAPDPHDRRATNVRITPKGKTLLRKVKPLQARWAQCVLDPIPRAERDELVRLLGKVQDALCEPLSPRIDS